MGRAQYCFRSVDDATNMGWTVFVPDKSAVIVPLVFRTFPAAPNVIGKPTSLCTDNISKPTNKKFRRLMIDSNIRSELCSLTARRATGGWRASWFLLPKGRCQRYLTSRACWTACNFLSRRSITRERGGFTDPLPPAHPSRCPKRSRHFDAHLTNSLTYNGIAGAAKGTV